MAETTTHDMLRDAPALSRLGVLLVTASTLAFSTTGFFTRLITVDAWTILFWRGLFGALFIALYIVWEHRGATCRVVSAMGWPGVGVDVLPGMSAGLLGAFGELRDALQHGTATVVEHEGCLSGYFTGSGVSGPHAVGETTAAVKALIAAVAAVDRGSFRIPLRNGDLVQWCLGHGFRVEVPETLMSLGFYQEPVGAFLPSGLY
jgi:hypothetical protein